MPSLKGSLATSRRVILNWGAGPWSPSGIESPGGVWFVDGFETREAIGSQILLLDSGEVDLDLLKPTGMRRGMDEPEARVATAQSRHGSVASVDRTVVRDPEYATGVVIKAVGSSLSRPGGAMPLWARPA